MASNKLIRKKLKNRAKSKQRTEAIKRQGYAPVIKTVDVEAIKESFKKQEKPLKNANATTDKDLER